MIIRKPTKKDLFSIAKVQISSNRSTYKGIMCENYLNNLSCESISKEWDEKLFEKNNKEFMYVAETDCANIVGFASGSLIKTNNLFELEVTKIYILKDFQSKGIGKLLMKAIITKFAKEDVKSMILWTLEDNPSRFFYEYLGGKIVDQRSIFRGGTELQQIAYAWEDITCLL